MPGKNPFKLDVVSVRLVKDAPLLSGHKITSPEEAVDVAGELMCDLDREVVCIINLKADGTPINCHFASMGAVDNAVIHPREMFKASILSNAANIILLHNHPSGSLFPSKEDCIMTDRLLSLSALLGIPLIDHIIVGGDHKEYFSFREKGILKNPTMVYATDYHDIDSGRYGTAGRGKAR